MTHMAVHATLSRFTYTPADSLSSTSDVFWQGLFLELPSADGAALFDGAGGT